MNYIHSLLNVRPWVIPFINYNSCKSCPGTVNLTLSYSLSFNNSGNSGPNRLGNYIRKCPLIRAKVKYPIYMRLSNRILRNK